MRLVIVTPPASTPVTLAEAKEQCRILVESPENTTHDSVITRLISAAVSSVESYTGARLYEQTVRLELDGFPSGDIELPVYPVTAITAFVYDDGDDVETTLTEDTGSPSANDDYWPALDGQRPYVRATNGWPATRLNKPGSVRITLTVGYAPDASPQFAVPDALKHAVLIRVKESFDNGGETITGMSVEAVSNTVSALLAPFRKWDA